MGLGLRRGRNIPGALGLSLTPPSQLYPHRHASHPQTSTRLRSPEAKLCSRGSLLIPQDPSQPITPLERKVKLIWSASWLFFFFFTVKDQLSLWCEHREQPRSPQRCSPDTPASHQSHMRNPSQFSNPLSEPQQWLHPSAQLWGETGTLLVKAAAPGLGPPQSPAGVGADPAGTLGLWHVAACQLRTVYEKIFTEFGCNWCLALYVFLRLINGSFAGSKKNQRARCATFWFCLVNDSD